MSIENYRPGEISSLGKAIYQKKIKHLVEPLAALRDALLPKLVSGELRVTQLQ